MYQTPRTPHARDNASLDPGQDADDADGENDDLYGDENVDTGREQEAPPTGKRGRSPNWLPCELVAAFLCRQHAVREKGCQSKLVERQNAATRVYSSIIHTLDDLGLCSWSDGGDGRKLPGNARESVTQRTAPHVESKIYSKGDGAVALAVALASSCTRATWYDATHMTRVQKKGRPRYDGVMKISCYTFSHNLGLKVMRRSGVTASSRNLRNKSEL